MAREKTKSSGSPASGEPAFLAIGKLRRPHGVHGEMVMELYTDFPERLKPNLKVFLGPKHVSMTIRSLRHHNEGLLVGFEQVDSPEAAGAFRNLVVYTSMRNVPKLAEGQYYYHQLIGLNVMDEEGKLLGKLEGIIETGANDVYEVATVDGGELLLPAIPEVIRKIDLDAQTMLVHLLPGLLEGTADEA